MIGNLELDERILNNTEEPKNMKLLTLEDYKKAGEQFWDKYWYVAGELGENAKTEDILKVMETLGGVALKLRIEEGADFIFGFNKRNKNEENDAAI